MTGRQAGVVLCSRSRRRQFAFAVVYAVVALLPSWPGIACAIEGTPRAGRVVVFDEGHAQQFHVRGEGELDLSRLAGVFERSGRAIVVSRAGLGAAALDRADTLVLSGPFHPLAPSEVVAVLDFLRRGGALAVMLHIGQPVAELLQRLGVSISNGVIREPEGALADNPQEFRVTILGHHPLTAGLESISVYGAWALLPRSASAEAVASTGPVAWVDLNANGVLDPQDAQQPFAVIVAGTFGKGRLVVFGDDALFQNRYLTGPNLKLAENLAVWLCAGSHQRGAAVAALSW